MSDFAHKSRDGRLYVHNEGEYQSELLSGQSLKQMSPFFEQFLKPFPSIRTFDFPFDDMRGHEIELPEQMDGGQRKFTLLAYNVKVYEMTPVDLESAKLQNNHQTAVIDPQFRHNVKLGDNAELREFDLALFMFSLMDSKFNSVQFNFVAQLMKTNAHGESKQVTPVQRSQNSNAMQNFVNQILKTFGDAYCDIRTEWLNSSNQESKIAKIWFDPIELSSEVQVPEQFIEISIEFHKKQFIQKYHTLLQRRFIQRECAKRFNTITENALHLPSLVQLMQQMRLGSLPSRTASVLEVSLLNYIVLLLSV